MEHLDVHHSTLKNCKTKSEDGSTFAYWLHETRTQGIGVHIQGCDDSAGWWVVVGTKTPECAAVCDCCSANVEWWEHVVLLHYRARTVMSLLSMTLVWLDKKSYDLAQESEVKQAPA